MVTFSSLLTISLVALSAQLDYAAALPSFITGSTSSLKHRILHYFHVDRSEGASNTARRFSFARWVDDKFAHPDTALSPEQAWEAYLDSVADDDSDDSPAQTGSEKRWDSQVKCSDTGKGKTNDVVTCISILHAAVHFQNLQYPCQTYPIEVSDDKGENKVKMQAWCHWNETVVGPYLDKPGDGKLIKGNIGCSESVAQTVGVILDTCTNKEHMVAGYRERDLTGLKVGVVVTKSPRVNVLG
ncbi:hypothetical protein B0T20DRAFT_500185 [Sordaria brevicollis]|uniref:Ecp2 effector protein domain-containing protein n=1 Tax=Sordaria brevicollis TaxID=83679 RepID=A0AAE0PB96_SORBR|nr:hypothetical protein B0T20DRAFT_500185 [Sordaria brevicollis]